MNQKYSTFFKQATGNEPYPYQARLAEAEWPVVLRVPTGAGKTASVILSWLYRRETGSSQPPTRLVFCLPMRVLVRQTVDNAKAWLKKLGLSDKYKVYELMGGFGKEEEEWELQPNEPAILVGTQDMLLSRALNRGYAMSRFRWSVPFGLLNNDCQWVFDEVQLMGVARATSVQLQAFRNRLKTFGVTRSLWMSATLQPDWLETVDHPTPSQVHNLQADDLVFPSLSRRVEAPKHIEKLKLPLNKDTRKDYGKQLASEVASQHQPGTLSLVIVNTVDRAVEIYQALSKQQPKGSQGPTLLLLHSRFRPHERAQKEERLRELQQNIPDNGAIVVSTQVVEAGVDLSARLLVTELCPYSSFVQRLGRCNRDGLQDGGGLVLWVDVQEPVLPYEPEQLLDCKAIISKLDDASPASLEKLGCRLDEAESLDVIREKDLVELFQTTSDLAGDDVDVSRYIREPNHLDLQVFWRPFDGAPTDALKLPRREELCSVSISAFRDFLSKDRRAYRWNYAEDTWSTIDKGSLKPGMVLLLNCEAGGYDPDLGFGREFKPTVAEVADQTVLVDESYVGEVHSAYELSLLQHTLNVLEQMKNLLSACTVEGLPTQLLIDTCLWHDYGKAHPVFQATMYGGHDKIQPSLLLGKSAGGGRHSRRGFRHEFASALAAIQHNVDPLIVFLVATHHGKVRFSVRPIPQELKDREDVITIRGVAEGDVLRAITFGSLSVPETKLSLKPLELGLQSDGTRSWARTLLELIEDKRYGVFRLAYLESLVRCADVTASIYEGKQHGGTRP